MEKTKAIYIIVEGQTDAQILHSLLDCSGYNSVYHIPAGSYNNLAPIARTIRLMKAPTESDDKIIVVFDSDTDKKDAIEDRIATMRYLTNADFDNRIEVFCFVPTIEAYLFPPEYQKKRASRNKLVEYLRQHLIELQSKSVIKSMQAFINK